MQNFNLDTRFVTAPLLLVMGTPFHLVRLMEEANVLPLSINELMDSQGSVRNAMELHSVQRADISFGFDSAEGYYFMFPFMGGECAAYHLALPKEGDNLATPRIMVRKNRENDKQILFSFNTNGTCIRREDFEGDVGTVIYDSTCVDVGPSKHLITKQAGDCKQWDVRIYNSDDLEVQNYKVNENGNIRPGRSYVVYERTPFKHAVINDGVNEANVTFDVLGRKTHIASKEHKTFFEYPTFAPNDKCPNLLIRATTDYTVTEYTYKWEGERCVEINTVRHKQASANSRKSEHTIFKLNAAKQDLPPGSKITNLHGSTGVVAEIKEDDVGA